MKNFFLLLILLTIFCGINAIASEEVLIARVSQWPPYYFQQNGIWIGANIDAYKALAKEADIKIEFKMIPWSRTIKIIKENLIIMSMVSPTDERKKIMHFIGPHAIQETSLVISKKHLDYEIKNLDDLVMFCIKTGRKIAYRKDIFYSKEFNDRIKTDSDFSKYFEKKASYDTIIKMLERGRISGFLQEKALLAYKLKHEQKSDIVAHPFIIDTSDVYFGVSKAVSEKTLKKLHEANERLISDGTYKKIMEKWRN